MTRKRDDKALLDRRNFLLAMGGASTAAAVAVASPMVATEAEAMDLEPEEMKARYRETENVKAFYRTNRY